MPETYLETSVRNKLSGKGPGTQTNSHFQLSPLTEEGGSAFVVCSFMTHRHYRTMVDGVHPVICTLKNRFLAGF